MAQGVGGNPRDARDLRIPLHDQPEALASESLPMMVQEKARLIGVMDERVAPIIQIDRQGMLRYWMQRQQPLAAITSTATDVTARQVKICDICGDKLGHAHSRRLETLEHRRVALANGCF